MRKQRLLSIVFLCCGSLISWILMAGTNDPSAAKKMIAIDIGSTGQTGSAACTSCQNSCKATHSAETPEVQTTICRTQCASKCLPATNPVCLSWKWEPAWAKRAGGTQADGGRGVSALADGSVLVTGNFSGSATFGAGETNQTILTATGSQDLFIAKYNSNGTLAWAKRLGKTANADAGWIEAHDIATLQDGSAILTGKFGGRVAVSASVSIVANGSEDVFIVKYNANGTLAWSTVTTGSTGSRAWGRSVSTLPDGSALITGAFWSTVTFGYNEANTTCLKALDFAPGRPDIFVAKYNANGSLAWAKSVFGGELDDFGYGISALNDGSALVTGNIQDIAKFGPGEPNSTQLGDVENRSAKYVFIAKYNANGTLAWAKRSGETGDAGADISKRADGSAFVVGKFSGTIAFGPGESNPTTLTSSGGEDLFVSKYNANGTLGWAKRAGGSGGDAATGVSTAPDGSAFVTGGFGGTATFGAGQTGQTVLTSAGANDIFIATYTPEGTLSWAGRAGGVSNDDSQDISVNADSSVFLTGSFLGTTTFGSVSPYLTNLTSAGSADIFIVKLNKTCKAYANP